MQTPEIDTPSSTAGGPSHVPSAFEVIAPERAALNEVKAAFLRPLRRYVLSFETQAEAASVLGISQPRVSEIARGKISAFSSDLLIRLCDRAGIAVTVEAELHK